jgi:hypothetical protein
VIADRECLTGQLMLDDASVRRRRIAADEQETGTTPTPATHTLNSRTTRRATADSRISTYKGPPMPRVQVLTEVDGRAQTVMLTEHVPSEMFANEHYADQLVERMAWALVDAEQQEQAIHA